MRMEGDFRSYHQGPLDQNQYQYNGIDFVDDLRLDVNMAFYRTLDPATGNWWSVDPKAEANFGASPYCSMYDNPISNNDPNGDLPAVATAVLGSLVRGALGYGAGAAQSGNFSFSGLGSSLLSNGVGYSGTFESSDWEPSYHNGNIVLTAEKNDNQSTLIDFFGSPENAEKYLPDFAFNKSIVFQAGSRVKLKDNVFSKAIKNFEINFEYDENLRRSYNCHIACLNGTLGKDFSNMQYDINFDSYKMDFFLMKNYTPIFPNEAKFGLTAITFKIDHSAVFFGRSNDGSTTYVFEKPGFLNAPRISKLSDVKNRHGGTYSRLFEGNNFGMFNPRK